MLSKGSTATVRDLQIRAAGTGRGFRLKLPKAHRQSASDLIGDLILDTEDVVQTAIKMCRPNQSTRGRIHELHRHPQPIRLPEADVRPDSDAIVLRGILY